MHLSICCYYYETVNKILIFAHVPPPHHGQAVMVDMMLKGLREDPRLEIFHVDARVSDAIDEIGGIRIGKILRLFRYCLDAIRIRLLYGPMDFYYVPAPAKKSAIVRDWVVMALVRPWFCRTIFHWHAFGLGYWATQTTEYPGGIHYSPTGRPVVFGRMVDGIARWMTRTLLGSADLSIVLSKYNVKDAELLGPKHIVVVPNGIPDPCPDFDHCVLPERNQRLKARLALLKAPREAEVSSLPCDSAGTLTSSPTLCFLFLGHCMESKGLHDAANIVAEFKKSSELPVRFVVAGEFSSVKEEETFKVLLMERQIASITKIFGFADDTAKRQLFADADVLLFPTKYQSEAQPLTVIEALSVGLPCLVSNWRGIPEMFPQDGLFTITPNDIHKGVEMLTIATIFADFKKLRTRFLESYSVATHLHSMREAFGGREKM